MATPFYDHQSLKQLRKVSGMTQQGVAEALKKDRVTITRLETGIMASLDLLIEYCAFFREDYRKFLLPTPESVSKKFLAVM